MPRNATSMDVRRKLSDRPRVGSMRRCDPRASTTVSTGSASWAAPSTASPGSHGDPSALAVTRPLRGRDEGKLHRCGIDFSRGGFPGRIECGPPVAECNDRHGPLVYPVRTDETCDGPIREPGEQPWREARGVGHRQHLGKHGSGVPVDVSVSTLAIAPPGAPRNPGHDDGGRVPLWCWTDLHQGMFERVVPVHARGERGALGDGHVQLEREASPGRSSGSEQPGPERTFHRSHHARGQMKQPGEVRQVQLCGRDGRGAREHGDGRWRRRR